MMLMKVVLEFLGFQVGIPKLRMDSKAAKAICTRYGVGTVRHLEVKILWMQGLVKAKRLQVWKIDGKENIADLGTKVLQKERFEDLLRRSNIKKVTSGMDVEESKVVAGIRGMFQGRDSSERVRAALAAVVVLIQRILCQG